MNPFPMLAPCLQLLILALVGATSATAAGPLAKAGSDTLKTRIDEKVRQHFRNETQVGIIVGVVRGDRVDVWAYGERVLGAGRGPGPAPTAETRWEMGSITKTFTTTLLALEAGAGRVRLTDPVEKHWEELAGTEAGRITLEQLATHASGLARLPANFAPADESDPYRDYDEPALLAALRAFRLEKTGPPGYAYSNLGLGLLGHLLSRKLNGLSYGEYVRTRLLEPLAMGETRVDLTAADLPHAAQGYDSLRAAKPRWSFDALAGAGALKTTLRDLLIYARRNLAPGTDALGQAMRLAQADRAPTTDASTRLGLGWFRTKVGRHAVVTHNGGTGGFRSNLILAPESGVAAIVLSNTDIDPTCVLAPVFDEPCEVPRYVRLAPSQRRGLQGKYRSEKLGLEVSVTHERDRRGGRLVVWTNGASPARAFALSPHRLTLPQAGADLTFDDVKDGPSPGFTLRQGGGEYRFTRVVARGGK